jgi:hypothetical protein
MITYFSVAQKGYNQTVIQAFRKTNENKSLQPFCAP